MRKNTKKKWAILLSLALVSGTISVPKLSEKKARAAVSFDKVLPEDTSGLSDGNYRLTGNVTSPIVIKEDSVVNIDLAGFTVNSGNQGSAILIEDDARLGLYDSKGTGKITGKSGTKKSGMTGGAGVYICDDATFEMYGGTITECELVSSGEEIGGAGIFVKDDAKCLIHSGHITKNKLSPATGKFGYGSGIYAAGDVSFMGGSIEGNGGTNILGGGIYTTRTLLVGGKSLIRSNSAIEGGGIYLSAIDETMVCDLSGGTITGNIATNGGRGGGIYITSGDVHLAGSADLSAQATGSDDIHFAQFVSGSTPGAGCRFSHRYPTKSGYSFELHKDSPSGEDVTGMYWGEAGKILNDDTAFYVVWKYETPTSEPVITPTAIPTVVPSMPPVPTSTPVTSPAASIVPTETPAATETPIPSYGPGEGKDSEVYTSLSDKDKKLVDELVKKDGTISYPTAVNMVLYARQNGITEKELLLTDKVIRSYKANTSLKGSTAGELSVKVIQVKKKSLTLKWKKQSKADGYRIYGNKKKKSKALKFIKSVKQGTFKKKITDLKKGTSYKYVIQAYRVIDGARMTVTVSAMVFGKTQKGKKQK